MVNYTFPTGNTSVIDWLAYTNQVSNTSYAIATLVIFWCFLLPMLYLINRGNDKTDSLLFSAIFCSIILFVFSLVALVPSSITIYFVIFTAIATMMKIFTNQ